MKNMQRILLLLAVFVLAGCMSASGLNDLRFEDSDTDTDLDAGLDDDAGCPWLCLEHAEWCDMLETGIARPELFCPGGGLCCEWEPAAE